MARVRISLGEADRERLGAPEVLEVDTDDIDIDELMEIEDVLGLDLVGYLDGWPKKVRTMKATVWLGLRRAGVEVPLADLKFKVYGGARYERVPADAASPGKDVAEGSPSTPPTDSETS